MTKEQMFLIWNKAAAVTITLKDYPSENALEYKLIKQIQKINNTDYLRAILALENTAASNSSATVLTSQRTSLNGVPAIQFAQVDSMGPTYRTTIVNGGNNIDILVQPKSLDANDPGMQTYFKMLSSFHFVTAP